MVVALAAVTWLLTAITGPACIAELAVLKLTN